jgi:hypothetical protein
MQPHCLIKLTYGDAQAQQLLLAQPGQQSAAAAASTGAEQEQEPQRPPSKTCSKCKTEKPSAEFFRDKSKPDGMYSQVCAAPKGTSLLLQTRLSCDRHETTTSLQCMAGVGYIATPHR